MAFRALASATGSSTIPAVGVPTGTRIGDVVVIAVSSDVNTWTLLQASWPAGFTALDAQALGPDGQSVGLGWKQIIGNDTGNYTFAAQTGSVIWQITASAFTSRGQPGFTTNKSTAANTSPVSMTALGAQVYDGDDLMWITVPDNSVTGTVSATTQPAGFTKQYDTGSTFNYMCVATQDKVSGSQVANQVGSITLSSGNAGWQSWLVRLPVQSTYRVGRMPGGV